MPARTATAASINARAAPGSVRIVGGRELLRAWKPEDGREKWFCGACGSALFSSTTDFGDLLGIRMGAFGSDPGIRPSARFFVASAAPWEPIAEDGFPASLPSAVVIPLTAPGRSGTYGGCARTSAATPWRLLTVWPGCCS